MNFSDPTKYFDDDGNVSVSGVPTGVRLAKIGNSYAASGYLTSSTFDTGTSQSNYTTLSWNPTSQNASTTLKFQIATNNDNATWSYVGPDGTNATYYTTPNSSIASANDNSRYLRYRAYL